VSGEGRRGEDAQYRLPSHRGEGNKRSDQQQHGAGRSLEVIGVTAPGFGGIAFVIDADFGDDERRRQAAEYGAANFLAKPVEFEHLKAQLRQLPGVPD